MAELDDLRSKTGELLDEGLKTGLLTPEEHSWRRGHLAQASTAASLEALVEDLLTPSAPAAVPSLNRPPQVNLLSNRTFALADLDRRTELVTVLGSTRINLTGLSGQAPLTLELVTLLGDVVVEVPPGVRVRVEATPVLGDCRVDPSLQSPDGEVKITGVVLLGSLRVTSMVRSH